MHLPGEGVEENECLGKAIYIADCLHREMRGRAEKTSWIRMATDRLALPTTGSTMERRTINIYLTVKAVLLILLSLFLELKEKVKTNAPSKTAAPLTPSIANPAAPFKK